MYKDNPHFEVPADLDASVWRYMQKWKLIDMLETSTLYLPRADQFDDKFEGILPKVTANEWPNMAQWIREQKEQAFVSCWHQHKTELDLMWRAYIGDETGVVVGSTFRRLIDSLRPSDEALFVGRVRYIDFNKDVIDAWERNPNIFLPLMHKRLEFSGDQEIRALLNTMSATALQAKAEGHAGVRIPVLAETLVGEIRVKPGVDEKFRKEIEDLVVKNGLAVEVKFSSLDAATP